jgi:hypothetical protein
MSDIQRGNSKFRARDCLRNETALTAVCYGVRDDAQ